MPHTPPPPEFTVAAKPAGTYLEAIQKAWGGLAIWDYLRYDAAGDLWINSLRVHDALVRFGSPLEIVDTTILERRAREWMALAREVAEQTRYPGGLGFLYAAKANMSSEIVSAALRAGWGLETSAAQELANIAWLKTHGLVPPGTRIVCNGFKLPPLETGPRPTDAQRKAASPRSGPSVQLPASGIATGIRDQTYVQRISAFAREGWDITPILDEGELPSFLAAGSPRMNVGFRLKFGLVHDAASLSAHVSRFGVSEERVDALMTDAESAPHLAVTTLHAMVGAAETFPIERLVEAKAYAASVWARLRVRHPTLTELNLGGGIPPLGETYGHREFLRGLFPAVQAAAAAEGVPAPDITFEFGSLLAAEAGFHVFRVIQEKDNHVSATGESTTWGIVDGGLMAAIPDMLFLDKAFRFLSVTDAHAPGRAVRIGDLTCDSDGRYPPERLGPNAAMLLPQADDLYVLIQGVGAYQEILAGVRGAHHCGLLEAVELILEKRADGKVHGRLMPRQRYVEAARVLGYSDDAVEPLRAALAAADETKPTAGQGLRN